MASLFYTLINNRTIDEQVITLCVFILPFLDLRSTNYASPLPFKIFSVAPERLFT